MDFKRCNWWRLTRAELCENIEWTAEGFVRARVDSITEFEYKSCSKAEYAQSIGEAIIAKQKKRK